MGFGETRLAVALAVVFAIVMVFFVAMAIVNPIGGKFALLGVAAGIWAVASAACAAICWGTSKILSTIDAWNSKILSAIDAEVLANEAQAYLRERD